MPLRNVIATHAAVRDDIVDLVTRRPLPGPGIDLLDPFLFLNHHGPQVYPPHNAGLPFGPHPHRGFETVTFILDGALAHRDTGGHESIIAAGGVQWMTAGRGLVHAELSPEDFRRDGGALEILQLWINLPARLKMTAPRYVGLQQADIPALPAADGRATINLIAGSIGDKVGPIVPLVDMVMATIALAPGGRLRLPVAPGRRVFLYVVRGAIAVGRIAARAFDLVELDDTGDAVELAAEAPALALFGHAVPFGEPVVSHGPFVMTTHAEIQMAIADFRAGKFGRMAV